MSDDVPSAVPPQVLDRRRQPYQPAVGPKLRVVLVLVFAGIGWLGASGAYLAAIRGLEWVYAPRTYQSQFSLWMFLTHVLAGVAFAVPFVGFGLLHWRTSRGRPNRRAVRLGLGLFAAGLAVILTGVALIQLSGLPQLPSGSVGRLVVYALHGLTPLAGIVLYLLHRWAGPRINWNWGIGWGVAVAGFIGVMAVLHSHDPRAWYTQGSPEGEAYFEPSKARTVSGKFIPAGVMMMDEYCLRCHADIYQQHFHSAHKFSSFNNPAYLFSVRETRQVSLKRDGSTRAARWCAGCHDPVPFFSGAFDDPKYDDVNHPTAKAGVTCTVCHAITNVNTRTGNADYTIDEPIHYPFAFSDDPVLQWLNNQTVKAKPEFHKKTFLKDFHRTEAFCSACHKVGIPGEVNHYKEFLRGQNHNDSYWLSGVSGHGARSFYYPPKAETNCAGCHMPLTPSGDFGAKDFANTGTKSVHDHLFVGANTGLPALARFQGFEAVIKRQSDHLRGTDPTGADKKVRIDVFGVKTGGLIDGKLIAPLRPALPTLEPGKTYLLEVVIRTLKLGHHFTQGTVDSNEVWVDCAAAAGGRHLGRSGGIDAEGRVDPWAHFVNVHMLDRHGNRIDRRNPQDIFTPLYDHQIPPGAAQVVHYRLAVPASVTAPVTVTVRLRYRKFDATYLRYIHPEGQLPPLPVVDLCEDQVTLPVGGAAESVTAQTSPIQSAWQRWNDYGIGCLLEGGAGSRRGELRQAGEAFTRLIELGDPAAEGHGYLNRARVAYEEGRLDDAVKDLNRAGSVAQPAPWWTRAWFIGLVNAQNGKLDEAITEFEKIVDPSNQPRERGFDFSGDFVVLNELGTTLFKRAQQEIDDPGQRGVFLRRAIAAYQKTLAIEPEDADAHYGLGQAYAALAAVSASTAELSPAVAPTQPTSDRAALVASAGLVADVTRPTPDRLRAGESLLGGLRHFLAEPAEPTRPRLPLLRNIISTLGPVTVTEKPSPLTGVTASILAAAHRAAHAVYKVDENAKDRTVREYRRTHPAADHAAEAVVIYDLK